MKPNSWITEGFEAFRKGTFGNAGQNLYVSKKGVLQRIYQYDLDRNGYVDLVFANCQNHYEAAPSYVYSPDGSRQVLPGQGSVSGMVFDTTGNGYNDIFVTGHYDAAAPFATTDIYFGSDKGYSEDRHIRIPTPFAVDCTHGDFKGNGKQTIAFTLPIYKLVRIYEHTDLGYEWEGFVDLPIEAQCCTAIDLDGDGFDDLIVRKEDSTETVVYWGGEDGINVERFTIFPEHYPSEVISAKDDEGQKTSEMEKKPDAARLLDSFKWNGTPCFTLSTGKKLYFYSVDSDRKPITVLELDIMRAVSVAVGDLDSDGYDDIAVAAQVLDANDNSKQNSFIIWNGPDGIDKRPRTVIPTAMACHVNILGNKVAFCQCCASRMYTNSTLVFTYPDFKNPVAYENEDGRRSFLFKNPDGIERLFVVNHHSRSAIGYQECFVYWGDKDGYDPERVTKVPGHCAVDALIADLDDDGWAELLIGNNAENSMHLDVGHHIHYFGENGFEPERSRTIKTDIGWGVMASDFNRDGYLEIITPANEWKTLRIFYGKDNFETYEDIEFDDEISGRWPSAVDVNGDGWMDLIVTTCKKYAYILYGGPDGFSFKRSQKLAVRKSIGATAADLTKNGYPDIIIGGHTDTPVKGDLRLREPHHSYVYIYWNGPEGISEDNKCILRGDAADSFAVADFNNDGWLDIFAGSYHGGVDRDVNSFLYWNREGHFHELDRDLLYAHSATGCMAADFNEDGYIDLALSNHKVDGDHTGYSAVWWNGPNGFNIQNQTHLPTKGPHGMISNNIGNIMDRSFNEYYTSVPYSIDADCKVKGISLEADIPPKTDVICEVRVNGGEWQKPEGVALKTGDTLEYRLNLYAYNCLRTPRVTKVSVDFE